MKPEELFEQLARQQNQPGKDCGIIVHTVADEDFIGTYGKLRAQVTILVPESVAKELGEKYQ